MTVRALLLSSIVACASNAAAQVERYRVTVEVTWSEASHPGLVPGDAHFSWVGGATHDASVSFWSEGEVASPGMVEMAETGATLVLEAEVAAAIQAGSAGSVLAWHHWFCPPATTNPWCGATVVEFDVDAAHPLVTLVSMLGPSPDWFVGVDGLPLHDGSDWVDQLSVDLYPYDGGTRSANLFALGGPLTSPPDPIELITDATGQLIGPGLLGRFHFQRVDALEPFGCETPTSSHGAPTLELANGAAVPGTTFGLAIANASASAGATALGLQVFAAPPSLQASTEVLGLCWNLPLPFQGAFVSVPTTGVLPITMPASTTLSGAMIDMQLFAIDPASTSTGVAITTSRGYSLRVH